VDDAILQSLGIAGGGVPEKPRIAPWAVTVDLGDDRLQFRGAEFAYTLKHRALIDAFTSIAPMLDGHHTVAEITASTGPDGAAVMITFLLRMLHANGLLHESTVPPDDAIDDAQWEPALRFFSQQRDTDARAALGALRRAHIILLGRPGLRKKVASALEGLGVGRVETADRAAPADLVIACGSYADVGLYETVNADCLTGGTRWLHIAIHAGGAQVGPLVVPGQTSCYTCYTQRTRSHVLDLGAYDAFRERLATMDTPPEEGYLEPFLSIVAGHAGMEVARLVTGFAPTMTMGRVAMLRAGSTSVTTHEIPRLPRCPDCGRRTRYHEVWDTALARQGEQARGGERP
jgi:bacteriocin biosynthesis cyclodehydratase domain-containing protein